MAAARESAPGRQGDGSGPVDVGGALSDRAWAWRGGLTGLVGFGCGLKSRATSEGVMKNWTRPESGAGEEFLDAAEAGDEDVDFLLGVIKIETRARRAREAELAHQRLVAVVAAAEGEAVFVGEGDDVVRVHIGKREADEAAAGLAGARADDADAGDRGEFFHRDGAEMVVVGGDNFAADGVYVVAGGAEGDGIGDVGRAGFVALGGGFPVGAFVGDGDDHAAAGFVGREFVEEGAAAVEDADAGGAAHFMAGEGEEIAAERLHIEGRVADGLGGVDHGDGTDGAGAAAEEGGVVEGAEGVGNVGEGDELHGGREERVERGVVEAALGVGAEHGDVAERGAGGAGGLLPRDEVGVVLHLGGEDDVAGLQVRVGPAAGDDVNALGGAAGENDFGGIGGVDELRDPRAGTFVAGGGAHGERVEAPVDVGVVALVVVDEGVDHGAGFLGSGAVVEIDEGLAVDLLVQDREIGAGAGEVARRFRVLGFGFRVHAGRSGIGRKGISPCGSRWWRGAGRL